MAQFAGQMMGGTEATGNWAVADGIVRHRHNWPDYIRNVGFDRSAGIDMVTLPIAPGWLVLLVDEPDSPDLPDAPFATNPPLGPPPEPPEPEPDPEPEPEIVTKASRKR